MVFSVNQNDYLQRAVIKMNMEHPSSVHRYNTMPYQSKYFIFGGVFENLATLL